MSENNKNQQGHKDEEANGLGDGDDFGLGGTKLEDAPVTKEQKAPPAKETAEENLLYGDVQKLDTSQANVLAQAIIELSKGTSESNRLLADSLRAFAESNARTNLINEDAAMRKRANGFSTRTLSRAEIDPNDVLEKPAIFFKHGFTSLVGEDYVNGMTIPTPYRRIIPFVHLYRQKPRDRHEPAVCICTAQIHSKKEAEFLRGHSTFGVTLFEDVNDARNFDAAKSEALVAAHFTVSRMNPHTLIREAQRREIDINTTQTSVIAAKLREKIVIEILDASAKATSISNLQRER